MERWHLFDTRRTPGRPEVQDEQLTAEIGTRDSLSGVSSNRKPWRRVTLFNDALLERVSDGEKKTGEENSYKAQQDPFSFVRAHLT